MRPHQPSGSGSPDRRNQSPLATSPPSSGGGLFQERKNSLVLGHTCLPHRVGRWVSGALDNMLRAVPWGGGCVPLSARIQSPVLAVHQKATCFPESKRVHGTPAWCRGAGANNRQLNEVIALSPGWWGGEVDGVWGGASRKKEEKVSCLKGRAERQGLQGRNRITSLPRLGKSLGEAGLETVAEMNDMGPKGSGRERERPSAGRERVQTLVMALWPVLWALTHSSLWRTPFM